MDTKTENLRSSAAQYEGQSGQNTDFADHVMVIISDQETYSFKRTDIIDREDDDERTRIWVRPGASGFLITPTIADKQGESASAGDPSDSVKAMEDVPPPPPDHRPDTPTPGVASTTQPNDDHPAPAEPTHDIFPTFDLAVTIAAVPPISAVATYWYNSCAGGDVQSNNCAHYLSDAFIRAGYAELASANPHVNARCATPARRPIRARDMWSWFQSKARVTRRTLPGRNTGWWAIFQLDESAYWGGHVVVLDSNAWVYYGTGWYGAWAQYAYQW